MISYVTIGTNDLERAAAFYDELLAIVGAKRSAKMVDRIYMWSAGGNALAVAKPQNGERGTVGNGAMVSIEADSIDQVFAIYNKAIELGATEDTLRGLAAPAPQVFSGTWTGTSSTSSFSRTRLGRSDEVRQRFPPVAHVARGSEPGAHGSGSSVTSRTSSSTPTGSEDTRRIRPGASRRTRASASRRRADRHG